MKKIYKFIIITFTLFFILILSLYGQDYNNIKVVIELKKYDSNRILIYESIYSYKNYFYSSKPLLTKVKTKCKNRANQEVFLVYHIYYDELDNPALIEVFDEKKGKIKKIILKYDESEAFYPFPDAETFEFLSLKPNNRLRIKIIHDLKYSETYYQKPEYTNGFLTGLITYNSSEEVVNETRYSFKNKNLFSKKITQYKKRGATKEQFDKYIIFLYDKENEDTLKYAVHSDDAENISKYIKYEISSDGNILSEKHFFPITLLDIKNFTPYNKAELIQLVEYKYEN